MTQFIATGITVICPSCGEVMAMNREIDRRIAHMSHNRTLQCPYSSKNYRVDRITGYGEQLNEEPTEIPVSSRRVTPQWSQR